MRFAIIALAVVVSTNAFAEDEKPVQQAAAPAPAAPAPAVPTEWYIRLDQPMINNIAQCAQEMKKREADPFLFAIDAQLKTQPAIIAAIKAK